MRIITRVLAGAAVAVTVAAVPATAASAAGPVVGHVAYVNGGNVWFDGRQLTHDGNDNWPRIRPGGAVVVYSHGTQLWAVGSAAGSTPHELVETGQINRVAWSPDGTQLAYVAWAGFISSLHVATYSGGALSGDHIVVDSAGAPGNGLTGWVPLIERTSAVAWSPDGHTLVFTGGDCLGIVDYCVSKYDLVTAATGTVIGFSGGGNVTEGFANLPAFSADGTLLYLTTQHDDPEHGVFTEGPVHVVTCVFTASCWIDSHTQVGQDGDTVGSPSPLTGTATLLVTGAHNGQSWVTRVRAGNVRTYLYQGYGQDWIG